MREVFAKSRRGKTDANEKAGSGLQGLRRETEHCEATEHCGRVSLPALHGKTEEGAGETMQPELIAGIEFTLAIVYAVLFLGTGSKVFRVIYFGFAVMCMVVGAANLM